MTSAGSSRRKFLRRKYAGEQISVSFDFKRCIHVKECVRRAAGAFDKDRQPWILPDESAREEVVAAVLSCPTGALRVEGEIGGKTEALPPINTIWVMLDGPLYLRGDLEIVDETGETLHRDTRIALCRCGQSSNTPFCDDAHLEAGFEAAGLERALVREPPEHARGGRLRINPSVNGPYDLDGQATVVSASGTGQELRAVGQDSLCRCGNSGNKPFCDGSHRGVGFRAQAW